MEWSPARILRIAVIAFVGLALYWWLEHYGLGWIVFAVGLAIPLVLLGLAAWFSRRANRRFEQIQRELDEQGAGQGADDSPS
jgi:uncharacterized membrane protein